MAADVFVSTHADEPFFRGAEPERSASYTVVALANAVAFGIRCMSLPRPAERHLHLWFDPRLPAVVGHIEAIDEVIVIRHQVMLAERDTGR